MPWYYTRETRLERARRKWREMPGVVRAGIGLALVILLALVALPATAEDPFLTGDALQAEIAKSCADGCITFNREEAERMQLQIELMMRARATQAFNAGQADAKQRCASLI